MLKKRAHFCFSVSPSSSSSPLTTIPNTSSLAIRRRVLQPLDWVSTHACTSHTHPPTRMQSTHHESRTRGAAAGWDAAFTVRVYHVPHTRDGLLAETYTDCSSVSIARAPRVCFPSPNSNLLITNREFECESLNSAPASPFSSQQRCVTI